MASGDDLYLITTGTDHGSVIALDIDMNNDTPAMRAAIPFVIHGSTSYLGFDDRDATLRVNQLDSVERF